MILLAALWSSKILVRKLNNIILKNNAIVLGISKDSIESHIKFKKNIN